MRQESETLYGIRKDAGEDLAAAVHGYQEYIEAHPASSSAHSYLAGVLRQMGDLEGSLNRHYAALRLAKSGSIRCASIRFQVGEVLRQKGETELAAAEFRAIIEEATLETKTFVPIVYFTLGNTLNEAGDKQAARDAWKQAIHWDQTGSMGKKAREMLKANP